MNQGTLAVTEAADDPGRAIDTARSLWQAVLNEALVDLADKRDHVHEDALRWITSAREDAGSFQFVCNALGLEAGPIRRRIVTLLDGGHHAAR